MGMEMGMGMAMGVGKVHLKVVTEGADNSRWAASMVTDEVALS